MRPKKSPSPATGAKPRFAGVRENRSHTPCDTGAGVSCARVQMAQRDKITIYGPMDYATYIVKI